MIRAFVPVKSARCDAIGPLTFMILRCSPLRRSRRLLRPLHISLQMQALGCTDLAYTAVLQIRAPRDEVHEMSHRPGYNL